MDIIISQPQKLWVPLHVHTEYSALDGAIKVQDYYKYALDNELAACAVTDHYNMSSWTEIDQTFKDVKPIFGCECYSETFLKDGPAVPFKGRRRYHWNTWALSKRGAVNIQKMAAAGYKSQNESATGPYAVPFKALEEYSADVAFGSACLSGELSVLLMNGLHAKAEEWLDRVLSVVGKDRFYIELIDISYTEQDKANKILLDFARAKGVKTIVTTDSHYMPSDTGWYDYLLAAQKKQVFTPDENEDEDGVRSAGNESQLDERFSAFSVTKTMDLSLRTPSEIYEKWKNICPEAVEETARLAETVEKFTLKGSQYQLPHMGGETEADFRRKAAAGLEMRMEDNKISGSSRDEYLSRLDMELGVVTSMGFVDYFNLVEDLVKQCREKGIKIGPGRGSAAGSMLAWSLGITELDPMPFNLLFERFLNPERISMPDIDIDFEDERRGEAISYLKQKYGADAVVGIINFSRCKWKNSLRDAARVMGNEPWQGDAIVKYLESVIDTSFSNDGVEEDDSFDLKEKDITAEYLMRFIKTQSQKTGHTPAKMPLEKVAGIVSLAEHFNGRIRNYGKHASGIVVSPGRADEYLPLGRVKGSVVSQWDMAGVDYRKLVKVDILGLSTLSMLGECEHESEVLSEDSPSPRMCDFLYFINKYGKTDPDKYVDKELEQEHGLTQESIKNTFALFDRGDTTGVFQFASPGMRKLLCKIRPKTIEDLSAAVALYRPGPLNSGITQGYVDKCYAEMGRSIKNKEQSDKIKQFPSAMTGVINEVASDTKGQIIYQEHIMQSARKLAGYSLGGADALRKAIGKKKEDLMAVERVKFIDGCKANGYTETDASHAFDMIEYFAGYGFNKSHSACYASLAWITAWYAANRAPVYWAALINDANKKQRKDNNGEIRMSALIREASQRLITLPPMLIKPVDYSDPLQTQKTRCIMDDNFYAAGGNRNGKWADKLAFALCLGLNAAKGASKNKKNISKLAGLMLSKEATLKDLILNSVKYGDGTELAAAGPLLINGYFDSVLNNTLISYNCYNTAPVYMRLALLEMAEAGRDSETIQTSYNACAALTNRPLKDTPFKLVKNRSYCGSFMDHVTRKLKNKTLAKHGAWDENNVIGWIADYYSPFLQSLCKRAVEIKHEMSLSAENKLRNYMRIYRIEKNDFGESITLPDWAVAAQMTGWSALMFSDEAAQWQKTRRWQDWKAEKNTNIKNTNTKDIGDILSDSGGFWVLGQFKNAGWKGNEGYISLSGRFGDNIDPLFIKTCTKLPIINIEDKKRILSMGGMVAIKVKWSDKDKSLVLCNSGAFSPQQFNCGFAKLPDSIWVLPLCGAGEPQTTVLPYANHRIGRDIVTNIHCSSVLSESDTDGFAAECMNNIWNKYGDAQLPLKIVNSAFDEIPPYDIGVCSLHQ